MTNNADIRFKEGDIGIDIRTGNVFVVHSVKTGTYGKGEIYLLRFLNELMEFNPKLNTSLRNTIKRIEKSDPEWNTDCEKLKVYYSKFPAFQHMLEEQIKKKEMQILSLQKTEEEYLKSIRIEGNITLGAFTKRLQTLILTKLKSIYGEDILKKCYTSIHLNNEVTNGGKYAGYVERVDKVNTLYVSFNFYETITTNFSMEEYPFIEKNILGKMTVKNETNGVKTIETPLVKDMITNSGISFKLDAFKKDYLKNDKFSLKVTERKIDIEWDDLPYDKNKLELLREVEFSFDTLIVESAVEDIYNKIFI